ncbi:STN domain-containing protein [Arcticibacter sp. MXS-1]|uniref:STN domain-containing protein n=1 Tax=Arcticibacter sp. MXS-1 TaxID=3341726 RepID=UPI0035A8B1F9
MKLTAILILSFILQVHAAGYAQKVSLSKTEAPLRQIFKEINKQTGYKFLYNTQMLQETRPVSIEVLNASIPDVLEKCFEGQPLTYRIIDRTIVVRKKKKSGSICRPLIHCRH